MREQILKLRSEGRSYNEIQKALGCSKSTIAYHCGEGQKKKQYDRTKKYRKEVPFLKKFYRFRSAKTRNVGEKPKSNRNTMYEKTRNFQRGAVGKRLKKQENNFTYQDIIDKFSMTTECYLTGRNIDLRETEVYEFDHKIPSSQGGKNILENLGITCKEANRAKDKMNPEEFIELCRKVLEHNGYQVTKE